MGPTPTTFARVKHSKLIGWVAVVFVVLAGSAMLRTSTTFDEIIFSASGARGLHGGDFSMVIDHPRLAQYLYGLPLYLAGIRYPPEAGFHWDWYTRYHYARALFWASGNSAEQLALLARLMGLACGALTVLATYFLSRRRLGENVALLAAVLVAFLPDVLAHSGVAYNDVPLTFAVLASVFAIDAWVREPGPGRAALAAIAFAFAACVKYSGVVLLPILAALVACEALSGRVADPAWRRRLIVSTLVFVMATWFAIAAIYGGDWGLSDFFMGLGQITQSTLQGREAYLLGERRVGGWWYFFPVAFLLKTPFALHVLMLLSLFAAWAGLRGMAWRSLLAHPARAPALAAAIFLAALLATGVNIGMRHALPMMPPLLILVATGVIYLWDRSVRAGRAGIAVLVAGYVVASASHYPFYLSYLSEYAWGRPLFMTLVDSNTDWGQGLVALRSYMRERGIEQVALGYCGTALPEGYGIHYVAMPSFLDLPSVETGAPRYLVVSATLLAGMYVPGDPYGPLRSMKPVAVVAETLYVFDRGEAKR
ncbi:MAG: phospholipid carrier-dependent glycosyltransferase [Usitatibacter sp.]